ncbi:MAG: Rpn family recombination-promoting nuclease/putative transposase [Magnetococcales bacterium]|nr:Rpn family recombination-promoting nuclease/putative transposase [Magnetococcales bacterium]
MIDLTHPHDRLFKALFSHPETAGHLLRQYLPSEVVALFAPETPELVEGSFVDEALLAYYSDRLFRIRTVDDKEAFIYVLMEHKSYPDRRVALQLARGIMGTFEQEARSDAAWGLLPAVVPLVLYHGERTWTISHALLT